MGILTETARSEVKAKRCRLAEQMDTHEGIDADDWTLVNTPGRGVNTVTKLLAKVGIDVAPSTVQRHRDQQCMCFKGAL